MDRILYAKDGIEVRQGNGVRSLWLNGACMGRAEATRPSRAVSEYMKEIIKIAKDKKFKNVLVVGGGAMLISRALKAAVVEPNIYIIMAAIVYFKYTGDYYLTLAAATEFGQKYDCVILDAYNDYEPVKELYNETFYNKFRHAHLIVNEIVDGKNVVWERGPVEV